MKKLLLLFVLIAALACCKKQPSSSGNIYTIAGTGGLGFSGDGNTAIFATFKSPCSVAVDADGNIYIADESNNRIRKVNAAGYISTFAGNGSYGYSGDGGPAALASFNGVDAVCVDGSGNLYIADAGNNVIRKVNTSGIIITIAGNDSAGYSGDGGPATLAKLYNPDGIAVDGNGNIYISDAENNVIRKVNTAGIISTFAGNGTGGYSGDGGPATSAEVYFPWGVAVDGAGNVYFADNGNYVVRKVNTAGSISTVAGNIAASITQGGFGGDGGAATAAELNNPSGIAIDANGNIYIADTWNERIRKVNTSGTITTFAGTGYRTGTGYDYLGGYTGNDGPAVSAELNAPTGITVDKSGNVYFADQENNRIRKIDN